MARIRSIKPEFWTSQQVMECSPVARLMFIGLWNFADDRGRHPHNAKQIKALIFPSDDITVDAVTGLLAELAEHGLISTYDVNGKRYLAITGWHHQKIDRPQDPKYPAPPAFVERSTNDRDSSSNVRDGEEKRGEEGKGESSLRSDSRARASRPSVEGSRIEPDWTPTEEDRRQAASEGLTGTEIGREAQRFRDYWRAKSGREALRADWSAMWRNWCRKAAEDRGRVPMGEGGADPPKLVQRQPHDPQVTAWLAYFRENGKPFSAKQIDDAREYRRPVLVPEGWPPGRDPAESPPLPFGPTVLKRGA